MKEYVDLGIQWMLSSGIRVLIIVVLTLIALRITRYSILKKHFDENNIEIPFPHLTFYVGQDKKGDSPPLHVIQRQADGSP